MTRVRVEDHLLRGCPGRRVVEVDADTREVVAVVALDYQYPGRDLREVAESYAGLRNLEVAA